MIKLKYIAMLFLTVAASAVKGQSQEPLRTEYPPPDTLFNRIVRTPSVCIILVKGKSELSSKQLYLQAQRFRRNISLTFILETAQSASLNIDAGQSLTITLNNDEQIVIKSRIAVKGKPGRLGYGVYVDPDYEISVENLNSMLKEKVKHIQFNLNERKVNIPLNIMEAGLINQTLLLIK